MRIESQKVAVKSFQDRQFSFSNQVVLHIYTFKWASRYFLPMKSMEVKEKMCSRFLQFSKCVFGASTVYSMSIIISLFITFLFCFHSLNMPFPRNCSFLFWFISLILSGKEQCFLFDPAIQQQVGSTFSVANRSSGAMMMGMENINGSKLENSPIIGPSIF